MAFLSEFMLHMYLGPEFVRLACPLSIWLLTLIAYHNSIVSSLIITRGHIAVLATTAMVNTAFTLLLANYFSAEYGVNAVVYSYSLYIVLQLAVLYLVSAPAAGAGSGIALASHVFSKPIVSALLCIVLAGAFVDLTGAAVGWGAILFLPLFALCGFTLGGVPADWLRLKTQVPA
jgi:hypothetical protein